MRDIAETIKAGERNRDTMVLVHNWCRHGRMEKFGRTGMIEAATGLPIGLHGMRCDYAPEGGFASWDFRDSVIDFYDRNCSACMHRKPVRLPNILEIVAERDRAREAQAAADAAAQSYADAALAARQGVRAALKPDLGAVAQTLVDDIGLYDVDRSKENFDRVTQSARLAPEHFGPALIDHVADLAASSHWFIDPALIILDAVSPGDSRIVTLALKALEIGLPVNLAASKLMPRIADIPADAVSRIMRGAVDLANPSHRDGYIRGR